MRVASYYQFKQTLGRMQQSNENIGTLSYQIASGYKAQRFQDIAPDVNQMLNLQDMQSNINTYKGNIDTAVSRLSAQESALSKMSDLLQEAASLWTLARSENSPESRAAMAPKAQGLAESFATLINSQFDGRYVFSGQAGERQTMVMVPTANTYPGNPPPTTYYNGDSAAMEVLSDTNLIEQYGVTGDNLGFARMKGGLEALWYGLENNSVSDIDGAIDLLTQAQKDISDMIGEVGGQMSSFELATTRHESNAQFLKERVDGLEKVDVAEALTKFSQEEATLQASMLIITSLQGLSLLDYMR